MLSSAHFVTQVLVAVFRDLLHVMCVLVGWGLFWFVFLISLCCEVDLHFILSHAQYSGGHGTEKCVTS